jgi:AraC-like DNA-binding protein
VGGVSVVVRAVDEPETSRMEYWRHVMDGIIGPIDVRQPDGLDARDRIRLGEIGAVGLGELSTGNPGGAHRTWRHIRRSDLDVCKIDVVAHGRSVVEQDGRVACLDPGDLTFVDLSRPVRWTMSPSVRVVAMVVPRTLVPLPADDLADLTAVPLPGRGGPAALVSSLVRQIVDHVDEYGVADGARIGSTVLDLLAVALAARLGRDGDVAPDARQRALLAQITAYVEERLGDPWLTPGAIAAANAVSVRYLHKLFEQHETTVASWIRRRRLERCRADLLDPALRARPVSAIGARWGFTNPAHFSRAFRATYGLPPTTYRTTATPSR